MQGSHVPMHLSHGRHKYSLAGLGMGAIIHELIGGGGRLCFPSSFSSARLIFSGHDLMSNDPGSKEDGNYRCRGFGIFETVLE